MLKTLQELFGVNSQQQIECGDKPPKYATTPIDGYTFRKDLLRDMLIFWRLGKRSGMLTGHKGSGKTSLVEQWHNRLQLNLWVITGNGKTNLEALFGQYVLNEDGKLVWQDGPVTAAARGGFSVLINEFNAIPPDVQLALMDAAHDGSALSLPEKSEVFMPAKGFRIFATINPKGGNEFIYQGRKNIDGALKERFFWIDVGYGSRDEEEKILVRVWKRASPELDEGSAMRFIRQQLDVAEKVRILGQATNASAIPEIISTRVLVNWAIYWGEYSRSNQSGAAHVGLQRALTFGCSPEVAKAIHAVVTAETGQPSPYSAFV